MRRESAACPPPGHTAWLASLATAAPLLESPEAEPVPARRRQWLLILRGWVRRPSRHLRSSRFDPS